MRQLQFYFPVDETPPPLADNTIHIWHIRLDIGHESMDRVLDDNERQRAARYLTLQRRRQFVNGRAALRSILADYVACSPAELPLAITSLGKPVLESSLEFNLSHSRDLALLAVSRERPVGIDLEYAHDETLTPQAMSKMAAIYFTPYEQEQLDHVAANERRTFFLKCWTRKEAVLKAHGCGPAYHADEIDVLKPSGEIEEVPVSPNYVAAVASDYEPARNSAKCWAVPTRRSQFS